MLAEDPLDEHTKVGSDVLADRPVDRDVRTNLICQLARNRKQLSLAEDCHGAVVGFEGIVEGEFVL